MLVPFRYRTLARYVYSRILMPMHIAATNGNVSPTVPAYLA